MKKLKIAVIIVFIFIIILLLWGFLYDRFLNPEMIKGKINVEKASNLRIGMNNNEIFDIMGKADTKLQLDKHKTLLKYSSNNIDYLDIEIYLDSNEKVYEILIPH